jgi:proline iminopeptidase
MLVTVNGTQLYVDVEGSQLRVEDGGLVQRPTIIVLHGGPGFDQGYLRPGLGPLSDDAQLVFVDLRGQGRSGRPSIESCTLEQMADDVAAVCELLGIQAPVVFGHSAGGFVALHLAVRHPGLVSGLVLCETAATLAPPPPDEAPPPSLAERSTAEAVEVAGRLFGGDDSPETFAAFGRLVAPYYAGPHHTDVPGQLLALSGYVSDLAQHFFKVLAAGYDLRPRLGEIASPALVMVGRYDWICPPAASRVLAEGLADAQLIELPESGHFPFSEEPAMFCDAVHSFLEGLRSTAPCGTSST